MLYEITTKVTRFKKNRSNNEVCEKEVTERYITDCELFSEAEYAGMKTYKDASDGDVITIKRSNVREIYNESDEKDYYYKATISAKTIDDKDNEKEQKYYVLIKADNLTEANSKANEYMRQGLGDMVLDGLVKTKIINKI